MKQTIFFILALLITLVSCNKIPDTIEGKSYNYQDITFKFKSGGKAHLTGAHSNQKYGRKDVNYTYTYGVVTFDNAPWFQNVGALAPVYYVFDRTAQIESGKMIIKYKCSYLDKEEEKTITLSEQ